MLNHLYFYSILFLISVDSIAINTKSYLQSLPKPTGTPERLEYEFKLAIKDDKTISTVEISKVISRIFNTLSQQHKFEFEKLIDQKYFLDDSFQSFIFKDYYYDTESKELLSLDSSMRLRYRWTSPQRYFFYRFMPFIKFFYPTRCEFQFKRDYRFDRFNRVSVYESRFEFRNESIPFSKMNDSPTSPWPFKDYSMYFKNGFYKDYKILPTYEAVKLLKESKEINFKLAVESTTQRYRSHLNIKNPWGTGPNPQQAFILTIDQTTSKNKSFYEIEIEIDRNIYTKVTSIANLKGLKDPIDIEAKLFSLKAKEALEHDLSLIQNEITSKINKKYIKLKPMFKYMRLSN